MSSTDDIRRRVALARDPRRSAATVTGDADHDPLVVQDCEACRGSGRQCRETATAASLEVCVACGGSGVTGEVERFRQRRGGAGGAGRPRRVDHLPVLRLAIRAS